MRALLLICGLALTACPKPPEVPDAGNACLDSPAEMTRAPDGQLPCELLPPGFKR